MTVRELLELIPHNPEIYIRPSGRKMYYDGHVEDIPETLKDAVVEELCTSIFRNDEGQNKRFYTGFGFIVARVPEYEFFTDIDNKFCDTTISTN